MKIKAEAAQLLLYRAALGADTGFPSPQDTAIAKIACNRAGFDMANEAMQIMGGTGYSEESLVEYCFRRTRGWMIAGGTIEILLNRVAEGVRSEEHTSELKSLMRISYAVFCLKKKIITYDNVIIYQN